MSEAKIAAPLGAAESAGRTSLLCRSSFFLTDFCGNLLFCIIGSYLLYFYTDVFGLSVTVTGMLLLLTRILDAIDAPIWGSIVDHTSSRYGRSRPWFYGKLASPVLDHTLDIIIDLALVG